MDFLQVLVQIYEKEEAVLGEEFTSALEKSATSISMQKLTHEQGKELIQKYCKYIPKLEQNYFEQCTDQFLALALNFCDKNLYYLFKTTYSTKFENVRDDPLNHNELTLYICKRILAITNKKWILLFVQSRMEQTKTVEKKFILLEMLGIIAKQIENKEQFFPRILPDVLRAVKDGMKKFEKYRSKFSSEELNQSAKVFQENFENWVMDFFIRFFTVLKNLPEIKNHKKLLSARDLVETDVSNGQIQYKNAASQTLINHYVILFYLDILQGVNEALHETGVFDEQNIKGFLSTAQKHFLEIIPGTQELVENFMYSLRFNNFSSTEWPEQIPEYTPYITYNLTGMGFFVKELFQQKSFQIFYSSEYKLKILLPYIRLFLQKEPSKAELMKDLIVLIPDLIEESTIQVSSITNTNYFNVPASKVLVAMLEPVGQSYDKPTQQKFLAGLKKFLQFFERNALFDIFSGMVLENENMFMAAFLFDIFRKELSESLKNNQSNSFTQYSPIVKLLTKLIEKQTSTTVNLAEKASILCSVLSTVEFLLMKIKNTVTNKTFNTTENQLLTQANIPLFIEAIKKVVSKIDVRLGDSFDEVAQEKLQINQQIKVDEDEQKLNHTKSDQLSMIKFHSQSIQDQSSEILNLLQQEQQ